MGTIRKQAILSSILVYIGFVVGACNVYISTINGSLTEEQYGLTRVFFDIAQNMFAFGSLGIIPVLFKFYPYYKDNLPPKENDLLTWSLVTALIGFGIVIGLAFLFKTPLTNQFVERSPLFVQYFYWVFPFAAGMLFFSLLEGYSWALKQTILPAFLKETLFRMVTTAILLLFYFRIISFDTFIKLFAFAYFVIFLILLIYLIRKGQFHLTFQKSRVTKKFAKKMFGMQSLIFGGILISALGQTIDGILIASLKGLGTAAIFTVAQYVANLVQVPQRSMQSISTGILSQAWKDKDYKEINRIYGRTSINLLIMALFIYGNVVLNITPAIELLGMQAIYLTGVQTLFVLGIARIIDAGTGVNGTIIATSTFWKFDFFSGVVMLALMIPSNYFLIKEYGIIGSAYAQIISMTVYNFIRWEFLRRKFNMQPFTWKTLYTLLWSLGSFLIIYYTMQSLTGWLGLFARAISFSALMIAGVFWLRLTPDALQLWEKWTKR